MLRRRRQVLRREDRHQKSMHKGSICWSLGSPMLEMGIRHEIEDARSRLRFVHISASASRAEFVVLLLATVLCPSASCSGAALALTPDTDVPSVCPVASAAPLGVARLAHVVRRKSHSHAQNPSGPLMQTGFSGDAPPSPLWLAARVVLNCRFRL